MFRRLSWFAALGMLLFADPAAAQTPPSGFEMAQAMVNRMVRVTGRQSPGIIGLTGYGLIVGEEPGGAGAQVLVIAVPYIIVRDPERPGIPFAPPTVAFPAEPLRQFTGRLLPDQLPPERGNLALITIAKPANFSRPDAIMADPGSVLPGVPVWQVGNSSDFVPGPIAARLAYQDQVGWLLFDGIDNAPTAIGAAVVSEHGLVGLAMGPSPQDPIVTRVLPLPFVSIRTRGWGHDWDIPLENTQGPRGITIGPTRYDNTARQADSTALSPMRIVPLLNAEATGRASWTPPGARISPWHERSARLFGSPRREAAVVGVLPAGRFLPEDLWRDGAYDIVRKLDGGAWFQIASSGEDLGFVNGSDVVEIWPALQTAGLTGGTIVREWSARGGKAAVLRDVGASFELETTGECALPRCRSAIIYTPAPPEPGSIVPSFQMAPLRGVWRKGDMVSIRAMLPRRLIETKGTLVYACIGDEGNCTQETIYPPAAP